MKGKCRHIPLEKRCGKVFMPPPLGAGGIMFSGCPSVRPSEAWNNLFSPVQGWLKVIDLFEFRFTTGGVMNFQTWNFLYVWNTWYMLYLTTFKSILCRVKRWWHTNTSVMRCAISSLPVSEPRNQVTAPVVSFMWVGASKCIFIANSFNTVFVTKD